MVLTLISVLIASSLIFGCGSGVAFAEEQAPNPIVTMDLGELGTMEIELFPTVAPNTVSNFISLVQKGYYDGVIFHRVIPRGATRLELVVVAQVIVLRENLTKMVSAIV